MYSSSTSLIPHRTFIFTIFLVYFIILTPIIIAQAKIKRDDEAVSFLKTSISEQNGDQLSQIKVHLAIVTKELAGSTTSNSYESDIVRRTGNHCAFSESRLRDDKQTSSSGGPPDLLARLHTRKAEHVPFTVPGALLSCLLSDNEVGIHFSPQDHILAKDDPYVESNHKTVTIVLSRAGVDYDHTGLLEIWTFDSDTKLPIFVEDVIRSGLSGSVSPTLGRKDPLGIGHIFRNPRYYYSDYHLTDTGYLPQTMKVVRSGRPVEDQVIILSKAN